MNKMIRTALIITSSAILLVACKNNNPDSQKAQNTQLPTNNGAVVDSIKTREAAASPQIKDGLNITRFPDGKVKMQGNYKDGKRTGEWQSFFENGKLNSDEYFTDGENDGKVVVYYENGQKMYEGENRKGKLVGVWQYWNKKGQLTRTVDYSKQPDSKKP